MATKMYHSLIMGKCCPRNSTFSFDQNIFKHADFLDRQKILTTFEFEPEHQTLLGQLSSMASFDTSATEARISLASLAKITICEKYPAVVCINGLTVPS